jgi:probable HAF family extracellular repeat protein
MTMKRVVQLLWAAGMMIGLSGVPVLGMSNDDNGVAAIDLGTLGGATSYAYVVNDNGEVVGISDISGNTSAHGFYWSSTTGIVDIATLGGTFSTALGINDSGQVIGSSSLQGDAESHAFIWTLAGGFHDLGTLGGTFSRAEAVNAFGQVVGESTLPGDQVVHVFSWTAVGGMVDITPAAVDTHFGDTWAYGVNDNGQVVGRADGIAFSWTQAQGFINVTLSCGFCYFGSSATAVNAAGQVAGWAVGEDFGVHSFVWSQTTGMTDLGNLGGSFSSPSAINSFGQVVGTSSRVDGTGQELPGHAYSWTPESGMVDLGTLGGSDSFASSVNDAGLVVGGSGENYKNGSNTHRSFLWSPRSGMVELRGLPGSTYSSPFGLNATGAVAGFSDSNNVPYQFHATLWPARRQVKLN